MRVFDVLTKAEYEISASMQPRYHLEMALLRWIHLRKLVPLTDLIQGLEKGSSPSAGRPGPARPPLRRVRRRRNPVRRRKPPRLLRRRRRAARLEPPAPEPKVEAVRSESGDGRSGERRQGGVSRRGTEGEEVLLRHGDRPGAAHRRRTGSHRHRLRAAAPGAEQQVDPDARRSRRWPPGWWDTGLR